MIEIKPIRISTDEYDEIEKKIKELFKKEIYYPLLKELNYKSATLKNAQDDLLDALRSGKITFYRGKFSGNFTATTSKELRKLGATWSRTLKSYCLRLSDIPLEMRGIIGQSENVFVQKIRSIDRKLESVIPKELASKLKIEHIFDRTIFKVEKEFQQSVKNITISPTLSKSARERISQEWQTNMHLWIRNFTEKEILSLRRLIRVNVEKGNRYEAVTKTIEDSYGVTARKAKFLARQETSLLVTKMKEIRYQDAGINEYKWRCVSGTPQHPTRKRHKALSSMSDKGKVFQFTRPPNTAEEGNPDRDAYEGPGGFFNNPGQDYNCRCTAIPVIRKKRH